MADTILTTLNTDKEFLQQLKTELHETLQKAQQALSEKTGKSPSTALYETAVSVVLGLTKSGKSQLFSSSEIIFKTLGIHQPHYAKAKLSHNALFIELNGDLLKPESEISWTEIAKSLTYYRPEKAMDSITIVLDIAELIQIVGSCNTPASFDALSQALNDLVQSQSVAVPVYIFITHTDRIAGFNEFFAELTPQQRQQAWGIIMPDIIQSESSPTIPIFQTRYQNFLRRLNQQQIPRLHATRNPAKRCLINEFPVQMEQLLDPCLNLLSTLFKPNTNANCRAIFFASAKQSSEPEHVVENTMNSHFALTIRNDSAEDHIDRPYFIHDILNKIIPIDYTQSREHKNHLSRQYTLRQIAYGATGFVSILLVGALFIGYWQASDYLKTTKKGLETISNESQESKNAPLTVLIPELMNLHRVQLSLLRSHVPTMIRFPRNYANNIMTQGMHDETYRIVHQLLPRLVALTQKELATPDLNPASRYQALKAYLMLATGNKLDRHFLETYLVSLMSVPSQKNKNELQDNLGFLLSEIELKPNQTLLEWEIINENRKLLSLLPRDYLGYELLRLELNHATHTYKNKVFGDVQVPLEFTHEGFALLIQEKLPTISAELSQSQWVFDEANRAQAPNSQQKLTESILRVYANKYVQWWTGFSQNIMPQHFQTLQEAENIFSQLSEDESSLTELLDVLSENTQMMPGKKLSAQLFNHHIGPKLSVYAKLDQQFLPQAAQLFRQMKTELHEINTSTNPSDTILVKTKQRFNSAYESTSLGKLFSSIEKYPYPINEILSRTAKPTWELMMQESMNQINKLWFDNVYQEYEAHLYNHYPLNKTSQTEIPIAQFNHFFSNRGTLHQFFLAHIAVFLDTSTAEWRLKEVDGLSLPLTQEMVDQLERANIIRQMFFGDKNQSPVVNFSLRSNSLAPSISAVSLDVYGQRKMDYAGSSQTMQLRWPHDPQHQQMHIISYDEAGKEQELTFNGTWALFRAIDNAQVSREDSKHYLLKFHFKDKAEVVYELTAENELNPFIPDITAQFHITHRLTA